MLDTYRAAYRAPGSAAFSAASFVMRLPIAIYPLGLLLLISTRTHHYTFAGVLSGVFILGGALGNPIGGRLVDRYGQGRVIAPMTAGHVAAAAVLVVLARERLPEWTLLLPAIVLGFCYLPVGSMVRARWSFVLDESSGPNPALATAYSIESTIDEVVYVVGPLVASVIATEVSPLLVMILAAGLVGVGALLLVRMRSTEPPPHPVGEARRRSAMHERGMVVMFGLAIAMGIIFSSAEVAIVAFCGHRGEQSLTGAALACLAFGSALSGLWYGSRTWQWSLLDRFLLQALIFGVLPWLFLAAVNVGTLAICAFVVGLSVAPTLITLFGLVSNFVASAALTEGLAWLLTGSNIGYGIAAPVTGRISDAWGTRPAFAVTGAAATALALLALRLHAMMRKSEHARISR